MFVIDPFEKGLNKGLPSKRQPCVIPVGHYCTTSEMYLLTGCYRYKREGMQAYSLYFKCPTGQ